jgi:hypothetical protein
MGEKVIAFSKEKAREYAVKRDSETPFEIVDMYQDTQAEKVTNEARPVSFM